MAVPAMTKPPWPSMTSPELIAALDAMCTVALCARRRKRDGEIVYSLSVDEIHEADDLLSGRFHGGAAPVSAGDDALERMAGMPPGGGDLGQAITTGILDLISARMRAIGADVEPVMHGVASAYIALAYAFEGYSPHVAIGELKSRRGWRSRNRPPVPRTTPGTAAFVRIVTSSPSGPCSDTRAADTGARGGPNRALRVPTRS
jgi:hypothetical protein